MHQGLMLVGQYRYKPKDICMKTVGANSGCSRVRASGTVHVSIQGIQAIRHQRWSRHTICNAAFPGAPENDSTNNSEKIHKHESHDLPHLESWEVDQPFPVRHPSGYHTEGEFDEAEEDFDPLRDGPLRYCGYANELGEAFAAWLPAYGVPASYAIAVGYVLVDTVDKAIQAHNEAKEAISMPAGNVTINPRNIVTLITSDRAIDTLLWQLLASVVIPGFTIHQVVALSHMGLCNVAHINDSEHMAQGLAIPLMFVSGVTGLGMEQTSLVLERVLPTMAGLMAIPFIVHPIDNAVHLLLNTTLRPYMHTYICEGGKGREAGLEMCELTSDDESEPVRGDSISSFNYYQCLESENCSVVAEFRNHNGDAKHRDSKSAMKAIVKAVLMTSPVAAALLASQSL